jgi:hypothetical protein
MTREEYAAFVAIAHDEVQDHVAACEDCTTRHGPLFQHVRRVVLTKIRANLGLRPAPRSRP